MEVSIIRIGRPCYCAVFHYMPMNLVHKEIVRLYQLWIGNGFSRDTSFHKLIIGEVSPAGVTIYL